jgi:outer membrane protein assembly factor BamB
MQIIKRCSAHPGLTRGLVIACVLLSSYAPPASWAAPSVPPGAPAEDVRFVDEWPAPNGDLYNTRVAHSTISSSNVSRLGVAWTIPMTGAGIRIGMDVANPVLADGVAYLQDAASNVTAVQYATGRVLWTQPYDSPSNGPNGVTIADGRIYGVTATGVFALDAQTGREVWYRTDLAPGASFGIAPQVAAGRVFVASAVTIGGGSVYALDAVTGATIWSFQTVVDEVGRQLPVPAGGVWDAVLIGPDQSVYAGIGNPYLSQQEAQATPSRQLYTDSLVKLSQATGQLEWYFQAFPNDFHDWDLQVSPIYAAAAGREVVLAAGKGGFVFALDPASGQPLWKTSVGVHNGHDDDGQLALDGTLRLEPPYVLYPGEIGGVETNMAAADGVVYVPVVNSATTFTSATARLGTPDITGASGEMVAIDLATGQQLWTTPLSQMPLGGATISNDLVFTTTFDGEVVALSRTDGSIAWTAQLPAGSNATLAIAGNTLLAGAGVPLGTTQQPVVVAYRLGAQGGVARPPTPPVAVPGPGK